MNKSHSSYKHEQYYKSKKKIKKNKDIPPKTKKRVLRRSFSTDNPSVL